MFGANVNPLGLSGQVKKDLAEHLDIISSYPDRDYTDLKKSNCCIYQYLAGTYCCRKWFYGAYLTSDQPARTKKALLLGPTYSEYARELNLVGGTLEYYNLKEEQDFQTGYFRSDRYTEK